MNGQHGFNLICPDRAVRQNTVIDERGNYVLSNCFNEERTKIFYPTKTLGHDRLPLMQHFYENLEKKCHTPNKKRKIAFIQVTEFSIKKPNASKW